MGQLKETLKGISWMTGLEILTKSVAIGKIAILARILSPAQFGAYGIALLVLGFLEVITETGINVFLIQEKDDVEVYLDSAWVVSIFRGVLVAFLIVIFAPVIVSFFGTPQIINLFYLVAILAIVRGFINPIVVVFQKKLEFMKVFVFRGGLYFVDAIVAVGLGLLTRSESAMILSMIAAAVVEVVLSFTLFKVRPRFKIDKQKFWKVIHSGKWITGAGIFAYIFQNIDNVTIGKLLGTTSLGFYQQSYAIANLPVSGVGDIFNRVMFPYFVKISDDIKKLRDTFYKTLLAILFMALIFGLTIHFFSHPIIKLFLGESWLVIEPTLKILAIFGVLKAILNSTYSLLLALKKQKIVMLSEMFGIVGMALFIYPLVTKFGTVGAGYAALIAVVCSLPVIVINVKKIFH